MQANEEQLRGNAEKMRENQVLDQMLRKMLRSNENSCIRTVK